MNRCSWHLALCIVLIVPTAVLAQNGEPLIRELGAGPPVAAPTYPAPANRAYRVAWHVTEPPEKPGDVVPGFKAPANFLVMADDNGVPRDSVHLAIIVHGNATRSLLSNDAYKAMTGSDNGSIPLLQALHDAGVQVVVCGVALINRKVPRERLLPFVKVATSATLAHAILASEGYVVIGQ
jgi:intracellular sulfur oxidation DsrE/DsrF family protein